MSKILIIDFSEAPTHADSLYSQFQFLKEFEIYGLFHPSYKGFLPQFPNCKEWQYYTSKKGAVSDWQVTSEAILLIRKLKPALVYLNTGQGNRVRLLMLRLLFDKTPIAALHHNPQKLMGSSSQKMINWRLKKYFVLADYIKTAVQKHLPATVHVESFYPIFFEEQSVLMPKLAEDLSRLQSRTDDLIRVGIVGAMDQSRRDYEGLYQALLKLGDKVPNNLRFCFLGDATRPQALALRNKFLSLQCKDQFEFNDGFLPYAELFERVRKVDVIMPLLHPNLVYFDEYKDFKITGAYLWGLCYRKPFVFEKSLAHMSDFKDISIYYDSNLFADALVELASSLERVRDLTRVMYGRPDLSFEFQKKKYLRFLGVGLNSSKKLNI